MKGLVLVTNYEKDLNGSWKETSKDLRILNLDSNYWKDYDKYDFSSSHRLILNCGLLWSYTSVSPTRLEKINYKKIAYLYNGRGGNIFDKLNNLTPKQFSLLRARAKREALKNGIDFENEACFISSCDSIHGFYFPNLKKIRGIFFINSKPYLLTSNLLDTIIDY